MTVEAPLESSGLIESRQAIDLRVVHAEVGDGGREALVRYSVHLDTSYPAIQSRACAEIWQPDKLDWAQVAYLYSGEWVTSSARPNGDAIARQAVLDAVDLLRAQVMPLLAVS